MMEQAEMEYKCPHCGAPVPKAASFCFQCAASIRPKQEPAVPHPIPRRLRWFARMAALVLAAAALIFFLTRPKTYDGLGEVLYTDQDGTYQLVFAWANNPTEPVPDRYLNEELDGEFRFPAMMYVNHVESGANAAPAFRKKVASVSAEIIQEEGLVHPMQCSLPEARADYLPDAAWVSLVDFIGQDLESQIVFTITMENGDVIRVRQNYHITGVRVVEYRPEDTPMDAIEDLRTLLARIDQEVDSRDVVRIFLPPVTYDDALEIRGRRVSLIGTDGPDGSRTTFTDTVTMNSDKGVLPQFEHIDFVGNGTGVGVAASEHLHIYDCRFTGWKTGVLAYGHSWVNIRSSRFENNRVGFHFNSEGMSATHSRYDDNQFRHNGVGILLERVPTDISISFNGTYFEGNETDIDNRCSHELDISQATFR